MLQRPDHQTHPTRGKAKTPQKQVSWQLRAARSSSPKRLECQPKQYNSKASDNRFSMTLTTLPTESVYKEKRQPIKSGGKRSKDTWQSNTGYLAIYPWIHCKVSLDTFSGQFPAVFSWTHWIRKRQCVSWLCQTEDAFTPEGAGVSTEAVQFQGKWQQIQYDFYNTVHWFSLWRGKDTGYRHRKIPL